MWVETRPAPTELPPSPHSSPVKGEEEQNVEAGFVLASIALNDDKAKMTRKQSLGI